MSVIPKVSVVVPIYNVEKYLHQCVDSILGQTLPEIEVILVEDGSPDGCGKICDEYAAKDKRVRVIHQSNGGLGHAYNVGIAAANGEYIALVEPDDWIEPDMYQTMYQYATENKTDACKCSFACYNRKNPKFNNTPRKINGLKEQYSEPTGVFTITDYPLLAAYHSSVWSYLYKADFIKQIKFVETKGGAGYVDAPFAFEVLCRAKRLAILPNLFYHWRVENHGNSVSLTDERIIALADRFIESKEIIKKYGLYETLKEVFYLHAVNANYNHYKHICKRFKYGYFKKLHTLFKELATDKSFQGKYLGEFKEWVNNVANGRYIASLYQNKPQRKRVFWLRRLVTYLRYSGYRFLEQINSPDTSSADPSKISN